MSTPVKGPSTYPQNPHIGIAQMRLGSTDAVTCKQKNTYRLLAPRIWALSSWSFEA